MPYVKEENRDMQVDELEAGPGELNYILTGFIHAYLKGKGGINYRNINEVVGVLECAKLELYRVLASPYEDKKALENGNISSLDKKFFEDLKKRNS